MGGILLSWNGGYAGRDLILADRDGNQGVSYSYGWVITFVEVRKKRTRKLGISPTWERFLRKAGGWFTQ